jgi:2,3-bisphosphoglycerate-independent phosphoglycerate mutase
VITADHGVLETMVKPDGTPNISHTKSRVPFVVVDSDPKIQTVIKLRTGGSLTDVAPTVLDIMDLPKPKAMTGQSLLRNYPDSFKGRKVLLVVLDGWGLSNANETNPIFLAHTPVWDRLIRSYPFVPLKASGKAVGLLKKKAGNSESGHVSIGTGRVVLQDDARIALAIEDGSFYRNPAFLKTISTVKQRNTVLHLISLLSETSSHGSIDYPIALLRLAKEQGLKKVQIHAIFDGRSTKIRSAPRFLEKLDREMEALGIGTVVSGIGRALALDRDGDYQKTRRAYDALVLGVGRRAR